MNQGFFTNTIYNAYKRKENYSHVHTYSPSNAFPSYKRLLKYLSDINNKPKLKGFKLLKAYRKISFYQNIDNPYIIFIGIQETTHTSFSEVYSGFCNTIIKIDLQKLERYKNDLQDLMDFQKKYPTDKYKYIASGISIAGAIADLFLEGGYINEAITFNSVIEDRFISNTNLKHHRIYIDEDIFYLAMGKYAPNTKVYTINSKKKKFINPVNEFNYLFKLHTLNKANSSSLNNLIKICKKNK